MQANPYLSFNGTCEEAFTFYAECLGGKILAMMTARGTPMEAQASPEWMDKIMHARMSIGDTLLMGSDAPPGRAETMQGFHVTLNITDPAEAERVYAALSAGGSVLMPLNETFWAQRFGMFTDRFGTPWMINCEKAPSAAAT